MAIRGLLFDKDGTLYDFHRSWSAWARDLIADLATEAAAADPTRDVAWMEAALADALGYDLAAGAFRRDSPVIAGAMEDFIAPVLALLAHRPAEDVVRQIDRAAHDAQQVEAAPLLPLLQELRSRGLALGVATNDSAGAAQAHLSRSGVLEMFDIVIGSDSGHGAKPAPGMAHAFLEATGLAADDVAMVGDSLHDLHSGAAAGLICIGVLTGLADRNTLSPHAETVLDTIAGLPAWLDHRAI